MSVKVSQRHFGLDFIRSLAILSVVFGHSRFLLTGYFEDVTAFPLLRGVDVFFILSGFLIGTKFLNQSQRDGGITPRFTGDFLRHAALRILPMYFLFLIINIISATIIETEPLNYQIVFECFLLIQNIFSPHIGFFWESWSLTITVWFYVVLSLIMVIIHMRKPSPKKMKYALLLFIVLFLVLPVYVRVYQHLQGGLDYFWWDVRIRKFLPARFDSPFYGLLMAWVRFYYPSVFKKITFPGLFVAITLYLWYYFVNPAAGTLGKDIMYLITSPLSYALILPVIMRLKRMPTWLTFPFTWISLLSYSMYLINLLLLTNITKHIDYKSYNLVFVWFSYWVLVFILSWLTYRFFETTVQKQFDTWKRNGVMFFKKGSV